jgi:hypothetical protein
MNLEIQDKSIILLGNFNPVIIQPAWLAAKGLIREEAYKKADVRVISPQITDFQATWFKILVTNDYFQALTQDPSTIDLLKDLVVGIFHLLEHTPIRCMGINTMRHYSIDNIELYHKIGHALAPKKDLWDKIFSKPGMERLIISSPRPDDHKGCVRVDVQPSKRINEGLFIGINDHFEISNIKETLTNCYEIIDTLDSVWAASVAWADTVFSQIMEWCDGL